MIMKEKEDKLLFRLERLNFQMIRVYNYVA